MYCCNMRKCYLEVDTYTLRTSKTLEKSDYNLSFVSNWKSVNTLIALIKTGIEETDQY